MSFVSPPFAKHRLTSDIIDISENIKRNNS